MGLRTVTRDGLSFEVEDVFGSGYHNDEWDFWSDFETNFEPHTLKILSTLTRDDVYIDVGAWIGPTILWASKFANWCIGYEPDPIAFASLKKNTIDVDNIDIDNIAIGKEHSSVVMPSFNGDSNTRVSETGIGLVVEQWSLDELYCHQTDFIKIDVEGYEWQVIQGAKTLIEEQHPRLLISIHNWTDPFDVAQINSYLLNVGYNITDLNTQTGDIYCVHNSM